MSATNQKKSTFIYGNYSKTFCLFTLITDLLPRGWTLTEKDAAEETTALFQMLPGERSIP